jgi:hypothetical protein
MKLITGNIRTTTLWLVIRLPLLSKTVLQIVEGSYHSLFAAIQGAGGPSLQLLKIQGTCVPEIKVDADPDPCLDQFLDPDTWDTLPDPKEFRDGDRSPKKI